jgi:hypothetical protein
MVKTVSMLELTLLFIYTAYKYDVMCKHLIQAKCADLLNMKTCNLHSEACLVLFFCYVLVRRMPALVCLCTRSNNHMWCKAKRQSVA